MFVLSWRRRTFEALSWPLGDAPAAQRLEGNEQHALKPAEISVDFLKTTLGNKRLAKATADREEMKHMPDMKIRATEAKLAE